MSAPRIIYSKRNLYPTHIALDIGVKRVYFGDDEGKLLLSTDYEGGRHQIVRHLSSREHGLIFYKSNVFWANMLTNQILSVKSEKADDSPMERYKAGDHEILLRFELITSNRQKLLTMHPCFKLPLQSKSLIPCNESQLCIPKVIHGIMSYKCLDAVSTDEAVSDKPNDVVAKFEPPKNVSIDPRHCGNHGFRCYDGDCIPHGWTCDGGADCVHGEGQ